MCPSVLPSVRPSVSPSVRPSVRSLPRYLRIALIDFDEIFRKVQSYAKLERDIFGFLKNAFLSGFWAKRAKMSKKSKRHFFVKVLFSSNFWNMNVEGWGVFWATTKNGGQNGSKLAWKLDIENVSNIFRKSFIFYQYLKIFISCVISGDPWYIYLLFCILLRKYFVLHSF